jgi:hypothetical protein
VKGNILNFNQTLKFRWFINSKPAPALKRSVTGLLFLSLIGCGVGIGLSLEPQIYTKENQIISEIGGGPCTTTSQCKVLTLSPINLCSTKRFLAYSTTTNNEARLLELLDDRRELIVENALLQGEIPLCASPSIPTPSARCEQQRCVLDYR